ncbi:MAG TPA: polyprenyl synthetase family protein [Polyangiaceae bacterium]|nr:polyprenyl synthetase family protein [Polyangiaceae bacterium]
MTQSARVYESKSELVRLLEAEFSGDADDAGSNADVPLALWQEALLGPLSDFLARPGKEFRARLVRLTWELSGRKTPPPPELPLIVEILHAGSLIIDDIEDGSAYRRGAPSLHCTVGIPTALNAGNWLYFWPSRLLARLELPPMTELTIHRLISKTLLACHEGQALDLRLRVCELEQRAVPGVVRATTRLKTGKLFELAASMGAIAAGAPSPTVRAVADFGQALGVGLQMLDDFGGILSQRRCHEGHEDLINGRATWPWAWAAERLDRLRYSKLRELGREVSARERHPEFLSMELKAMLACEAPSIVSRHLTLALSELRQVVGSSRALEEMGHEITLIEASYA